MNRPRLTISRDVQIDFAVGVLVNDGLQAGPFTLHHIWRGPLQHLGLTASMWLEWMDTLANERSATAFPQYMGYVPGVVRGSELISASVVVTPPVPQPTEPLKGLRGAQELRSALFQRWREHGKNHGATSDVGPLTPFEISSVNQAAKGLRSPVWLAVTPYVDDVVYLIDDHSAICGTPSPEHGLSRAQAVLRAAAILKASQDAH